MKKYFLVISDSIQELLTYRLNFVLWRVRVVVSVLISYFLWQAVFAGKPSVFGYGESQMITYILLIAFLNGIVLSTQAFRVAEEINSGILSNFLIRPISYFRYILSRDISDKAVNSFFSLIEIVLLIVFLRPTVIIQSSPLWLGLFFLSCIMAAYLYFEIGMLLSVIGFWSRESWAPRFIFSILVTFLAGTYFPLDILPKQIYGILQFFPFTYLIFFPLKIYLGNLGGFSLLQGMLVMSGWILLTGILLRIIWEKGLSVYTAEGI